MRKTRSSLNHERYQRTLAAFAESSGPCQNQASGTASVLKLENDARILLTWSVKRVQNRSFVHTCMKISAVPSHGREPGQQAGLPARATRKKMPATNGIESRNGSPCQTWISESASTPNLNCSLTKQASDANQHGQSYREFGFI